MRNRVILKLINNECLFGHVFMFKACWTEEDSCPLDVPDCDCEGECGEDEGFDCNPEGCLKEGKCIDEDDDE